MSDRLPSLMVLEDEAFALLMARWESESDSQRRQADEALTNFARLSSRHQQALTQARADWQLMALADTRTSNHAPVTQLRLRHPAFLAMAACLLLCCLLTPLLLPYLEPHAAGEAAVAGTHFQQRIRSHNQLKEQTLPDGSRLVLNWHTELRVDFHDQVRHVYLEKGEALFQVAKDPQRPFIVHAGTTDARAVGTEFRVRRFNRKEADIAVSEGVVAVSQRDEQNPVTLTVSQTVRTGGADYPSVRTLSVAEITAWSQGMLVFDERPLSEVLQELERYTDYRIVTDLLPDPNARVSATYFIAHTPEALDSLMQMFRLQGEFRQSRAGTDFILRPALPPVMTL